MVRPANALAAAVFMLVVCSQLSGALAGSTSGNLAKKIANAQACIAKNGCVVTKECRCVSLGENSPPFTDAEKAVLFSKNRQYVLQLEGCPEAEQHGLVLAPGQNTKTFDLMPLSAPEKFVYSGACLDLWYETIRPNDMYINYVEAHPTCLKCGAQSSAETSLRVAQLIARRMGVPRVHLNDEARLACDGDFGHGAMPGGLSLLKMLTDGQAYYERRTFSHVELNAKNDPRGDTKRKFDAARETLRTLSVGGLIDSFEAKRASEAKAGPALDTITATLGRFKPDPEQARGETAGAYLSWLWKEDCKRYPSVVDAMFFGTDYPWTKAVRVWADVGGAMEKDVSS